MPDYSKFIQNAPPDEGLSTLAQLVQELYDAEVEVIKCEMRLKKAKKIQEFVAEKTIPNHMETLGLQDFTTKSGTKISIKSKITASPTADNKPRVHNWLITKGHGQLIKRTLSMLFGINESKQAKEIKDLLLAKKLAVQESLKVEASTLSAFVRKQLEAGVDIPMKMFGVYDRKIAKIVEGKPPEVFEGEDL